ncbi:MAG: S-adenosylmethionine:tRNA ribosyltransferase-isomerase [Bacteroidia bacterium]|nr:S-adenosylmethionine:tRNA ribosyltransferase-isomerase [Bacteroidia bacterium]
MEPQNIRIQDYCYNLPPDRIAKYPLENRDASKLLIYKHNEISESVYSSLDHYLPNGSVLFFNNTKVIPARLFFKTTDNKLIEIFCLEPISSGSDPYLELNKKASSKWKCIVGGAAKWKDTYATLYHNQITLNAEKIEKVNDAFIIQFTWEPSEKTFSEILEITGTIPIPPYLKRKTETIDVLRYQTIYAQNAGSVAAPTAGLHFTDSLLQKIKLKDCTIQSLTLHVGAGTFKPVKTSKMLAHQMHQEYIDVDLQTLKNLLASFNQSIIAVGTTSLRTLESLYWIGLKLHKNKNLSQSELEVKQWEPYENENQLITKKDAIQAIINYLDKTKLNILCAKTGILIAPGYNFKIVNALITNFHQPESTLILLVAALVGQSWRTIYDYALEHNFRFLSYGDGSLLFLE